MKNREKISINGAMRDARIATREKRESHLVLRFSLITATLLLALATITMPVAGGPATNSADSVLDSDLDGLSDYDEINIYGTDPFRESTDGDFYDDGQEILGYSDPSKGNLGGQMPAYVKWPGSSAFVAAYPQIDFTVGTQFTIFIHKELHFANRTTVSEEHTTGTIVTESFSTAYGVGDSHMAGSNQEKSNTQKDTEISENTKNTLEASETYSSQKDTNSQTQTKGYTISPSAGISLAGPEAGISAEYGKSTTTEGKTISYVAVGTSYEEATSQSSSKSKTVENTEKIGEIKSYSATATAVTTKTTSVSSVNLHTVATSQEWETAWSQDTLDAAQLRFDFELTNSGTTRTSGISDLRFTIKIGPYSKTYPILSQQGVTLPALNPGEIRSYTAEVHLTLDELREFDTNGKIRIYIEDYNLGNSNEEAYALDAYEGGVLFIVDDATKDDGSNLKYYLTYAAPAENYLQVLQRLNKTIPVGSASNLKNVLDISANETAIFSLAGLAVEENSAWFAQSETISELPFLQKEAKRGSKVILTYSKDSDYDNYPDRAERIAGTNPNDLNSHPNPNVITGFYIENVAIVADNVTYEKTKPVFTIKPKIANTGNYDAYGAEIRMLAPNSEIEIADGFSGGAVRIRPNESFVINDSLVWKPKASGVAEMQPFASNLVCTGDCLFALEAPEIIYKAKIFSQPNGRVGYQIAYTIDVSADNITWTRVADHSPEQWTGGTVEDAFEPLYAKYIRIIGAGRMSNGGTGWNSATFDALAEFYRYEYGGKPVSQFTPIFETLYNDPQGTHRFISGLKIENLNSSIENFSAEMKRGLKLKIEAGKTLEYGESSAVEITFLNPSVQIENGRLVLLYQISNQTPLKSVEQPLGFLSGETLFNSEFATSEFSDEIAGKEVAVLAAALDSQSNLIAEQIETIQIKPIFAPQPPQNNTTAPANNTTTNPPTNNTTISPPQNNTTAPKQPITVISNGNSGGGGGGGSAGILKCREGLELKDGKCWPKKQEELVRLDAGITSSEPNETQKAAVVVLPQNNSENPENKKTNILSGFFTMAKAAKANSMVPILVLLAAAGAGYYLFTRKYSIRLEYEQ